MTSGPFETTPFDPLSARPLLVRGETLKLDIPTRSTSGGKTWPVSLEDAAARVIAQSDVAAQDLAATPQRYIGEHAILEIVLHDYALAASYYPRRLFQECGFVHVGSAVRDNERSVYVAIPDDGLQRLQGIAENAAAASGKIQDGIQALNTIRVARGAQRDRLPAGAQDRSLVEIVLHGQPDAGGAAAAAGDRTVDSVTALVSETGGVVFDCDFGAVAFA